MAKIAQISVVFTLICILAPQSVDMYDRPGTEQAMPTPQELPAPQEPAAQMAPVAPKAPLAKVAPVEKKAPVTPPPPEKQAAESEENKLKKKLAQLKNRRNRITDQKNPDRIMLSSFINFIESITDAIKLKMGLETGTNGGNRQAGIAIVQQELKKRNISPGNPEAIELDLKRLKVHYHIKKELITLQLYLIREIEALVRIMLTPNYISNFNQDFVDALVRLPDEEQIPIPGQIAKIRKAIIDMEVLEAEIEKEFATLFADKATAMSETIGDRMIREAFDAQLKKLIEAIKQKMGKRRTDVTKQEVIASGLWQAGQNFLSNEAADRKIEPNTLSYHILDFERVIYHNKVEKKLFYIERKIKTILVKIAKLLTTGYYINQIKSAL